MSRIAALYRRTLLLICFLSAGFLSMAGVEPYRNQLKGSIKKGDSLIVKDEKFRNPLFNWDDVERHSVKNLLTFRLTYDTAVVLKKSFTCELDLKVEYYSNADQAEPITLNSVKLKINFSPDSGAAYKAQDVYNFSNGYWVKITVNNITSPELGDSIPPILELSSQVVVTRKYRYQANQHAGLFGSFGQGEQTMSAQRVSSGFINADHLHVTWSPITGAEEYDLEWAVFDAGTENQSIIQQMLANQTVVPDVLDKLFRNNATRITTGIDASDHYISMVYNAGYILVRIRGVEYETNGYRKEYEWDYRLEEPAGAYAIWTIPNWHQENLNWQYSGVFAEDGKKKEVVSYFDGTLRNRQTVTVNNSDNIALVQETIYDEFGRAAASILPAPHPDNKLKYYPNVTLNQNNSAPYDYSNLKATLGVYCENKPQPLGSQSFAAKYYSSANPFVSLIPYTKYVPDAAGYPFSVTQYVADNTGRIRTQGGVGEKFQPGIGNRNVTKYYYSKPESWELDRLFGNDVGYDNHYLKNIVVDPNGQLSISYLNASGKTIATALAGNTPTNLTSLESKPAAKSEISKILRPEQFIFDASALSLTAKTTYFASLPEKTVSFSYDIERLIYTYQGSSFQICSNCYYDFTIRITNDCGQPVYQSPANTVIGSRLSDCNNNTPQSGAFTTTFNSIGEYYISFELKLNSDVINEYTQNYILNNTDLRSRFSFVLDYLNNTDFSGCFSECTTCQTALGTSDQFFTAIKNKLQDYDIDFATLPVAEQNALAAIAQSRYTQLHDQCLSMQATCLVSSCSRYEKQMLEDVSPGGQYALFQPDPFLPLEQDINVLYQHWREVFPQLAPGAADYEANAIYLANGDKTSPHDEFFTIQMLVQYWRPEWASRFLQWHPEKCKLDFCNANSQYVSWDDRVKTIYNKATDIPQIPLTSGLQYDHNNGAWLLAQDPFFKPGAPGVAYYSDMQNDLNQFSTRVMQTNIAGINVKSITQVIDYMLYCADPEGNTSTGTPDNTWNNCSPKADCRIPDREWQQYREMYFQLKEKYYVLVRNAGACADKCQVGTPYAQSACATSRDFVITSMGEAGCGDGLVKIKVAYAKGAVTRPMTVEMYYPAEYASLGLPASLSFSIGESEKTFCAPASVFVPAIKIKQITCTGNSTAPACPSGNGGQLLLPEGGKMTGTGKFEVINNGIHTTYTIVPGRADQPPADATYCTEGTVTSKQFYNCYKVTLPGGASADFYNVWVVKCEKDLCANAQTLYVTSQAGSYRFFKKEDGNYYYIMLQQGGGAVPGCANYPPVTTWYPCLKVYVEGISAPFLYFNAGITTCNSCSIDGQGITATGNPATNEYTTSNGSIYVIFPQTNPGYSPSTSHCTTPGTNWYPCFTVTYNGSTQTYYGATVLYCAPPTASCADPVVFPATSRAGNHLYRYQDATTNEEYNIVPGFENDPPADPGAYCIGPEYMYGYFTCIGFSINGQPPTVYHENVWVITCINSSFARTQQVQQQSSTLSSLVRTYQKNGARVYKNYENAAILLIKKAGEKDKQAWARAKGTDAGMKKPVREKGFTAYKYRSVLTVRVSSKAYVHLRDVWVAQYQPDTANGKKIASTALSTLAGPCPPGMVEYDVSMNGMVCYSQEGSPEGEMVRIYTPGNVPLCENQSATVDIYAVNNIGEVSYATTGYLSAGEYTKLVCVPQAYVNIATSYIACAEVIGSCAPACPDAYKNKQSRFPEFNYQFSLSSEDVSNQINENQALLVEQIKESCEAMADTWMQQMETCLAAYSQTVKDQLKAQLIEVCKRGGDLEHPFGASTTRPGDPNPTSFKQVIQSVLGLSSLTMACNPWLIDEPHPYEPVQQAVTKTLIKSTPALCAKLQQLHTLHNSENPGVTFFQYLTAKYGTAMNLTQAQLDALDKSCNNCRYLLETDIPLPVFLEPGATGCITAAEYNSAKAALTTEFGSGWDPNHANYQVILTNYINHRYGFAMSFSRYAAYEQKLLTDPAALLCNQPPYITVDQDQYVCLQSLIAAAVVNGNRDYDVYIAEEKRKFRLNYVNTCALAKGNATAASEQLLYHYTLYYYDQAGNLVRTVSPEGVRLLSLAETDIVNQWRQFDPATCTGAGIPSVSNKTATFNALSAALQNGSIKSLEMWLYSGVNDDMRHVRIITPDNKYLYQAAIADNKLWIELYTLLPAPVLSNRAVADITSINLQSWSHLLVKAADFTTGAWTVYLEGKKLTLMTSGQPSYPFAWTPGSPLPAEETGHIKHLRIYNQQPATDAEVLANYSNSCMYPQGNLATALTHWGRFNIPALCNPATETRIVSNQGALQVTGNLGMDGNRFPDIRDNFTVELWVNPTQQHGIDFQYPLGTGVDGTDGQHYAIYPASNGSSGGSTMGISVGTNGVSVYEHADAYMPALLVWESAVSGWTYIVVVYKNKVPTLYINGERVKTGFPSPMQFVNPGSNICSGPYGFMQGGIDDVRIWSVARTDEEILNSYQGTVPASLPGLVAYWPLTKQEGTELADLSCNGYTISPAAAGYTWNTTALPAGLKDIVPVEYATRSLYPAHKLLTSYAYNSTGQVIQQKSPDGGESYFWYDRLSRLIASQNEEQRVNGNRYSYTVYEPVLSRPIAVGEKAGASVLPAIPGFTDESVITAFMASGSNSQITETVYDDKPAPGPGVQAVLLQNNLRKRVSASFYRETAGGPVLNASYYDYDLMGGVRTLWQQVEGLGLKRIDYEYDLISGKTNLVRYQEGNNDQFYYTYDYDPENRLTHAYTGTDMSSGILANAQKDASYRYYYNGPLARMELGNNNVQGMDYAYTLQGWLKGVNGDKLKPADDMGHDAIDSYNTFAKDVFAFSLGYYKGDYKPIDATVKPFSLLYSSSTGDITGKELFNGNISHTTLAISRFRSGDPVGYTYGYDQLNRLRQMRQHVLTGTTTNWNSTTITEAYKETIAYDGNGNIKTYLRNGANVTGKPKEMDNLAYGYNMAIDAVSGLPYLVNNRLRHVKDDPAYTGNYQDDIDTQQDDYYLYDRIGNLIKEGNDNIAWTVYGKIRSVSNASGKNIVYSYDPAGNRVRKQVTVNGETTTTWYVRDAQGNVMGLYSQKDADPLKWKEQHLYGSSRVGMWQPDIEIATATGSSIWGTAGKKFYELTNHLGNVLAVITDKKTALPNGTFEADVATAHDYYPFGMQMPGRTIEGATCHEEVQDLTELKASSDLNSGVTQPVANKYLQNGVTWQQQANGIVSVVNGAFRVENSGTSGSDGMLALVSSSIIEPFTTYQIECDIIEMSPGITDLAINAQSGTNDPYRAASLQSGTGHRTVIFTTGATVGSFVALRISARPATAGLYFVVDNFVLRKYTVVNQTQEYATDLNAAVMSGVNVDDNGQLWKPFNTSITSLSVTGTTDKKIQVNCTNVNDSRLISEFNNFTAGNKYLVKFTMGQSLPDKRLFMQLYGRTGTNSWTAIQTGIFFTGVAGDYQFNFVMPAGMDQVKMEFMRQNTGSAIDGLNIPYTIDNFSIIRIEPIASQTTTVCEPNADPSGENDIYRYGFNGQEKSNEIKGNGNSYTAEFWEYDPRLGRRWNVDPVIKEWESPYACLYNNPISIIDPSGLDGEDPKPKFKDLDPVVVVGKRKPKEGETRWNPRVPKPGSLADFKNLINDFTPPTTLGGIKPPEQKESFPAIQRYHRGSKYFAEGWYPASFYELTTFDWDNGQVMDEFNYFEDEVLDRQLQLGSFGSYSGPVDGWYGGRSWNGFQVDDRGYLTGRLYHGSSVKEANGARVIVKFLNIISKLMRASRSRAKLLGKIQNTKLRNLTNDIYRPGAEVGDGSSMAAFRYTRITGNLVGGSNHAKKMLIIRNGLLNVLRTRNLNNFDKRLAQELLTDVLNGLRGY
ncbi:hypothetical protein HB364_09650 [Pseudoflavitalea sp. X16]|uniref:LamG-like jellyroll fold domain-containing protein n=1 Tax=Paraflavitalea devenefica TaxID=2716334 RepID=UPI00141DDEE6|nr:LamG-like jellyroll fold domain-containing protein [Paraflavitalea devenefica]NII25345.1 hypothetical protein [Paraflavitalea devenefica]